MPTAIPILGLIRRSILASKYLSIGSVNRLPRSGNKGIKCRRRITALSTVVRWMVGLTVARDFLYIVRSAALGDHHPVTSIEIIQLRVSSLESSIENSRTEQWDQRNPVSPVSPEIFTGSSNGYPEQSSRSANGSVNGYSLLSML